MNYDKPRSIRIDYSFFQDLVSYAFMHGDPDDPCFHRIDDAFHRKIEAMEHHRIYSQYKAGATQEIRSKARDEYLELIGLRDSYRWRGTCDANVTHNPNVLSPDFKG